jgi:hypothetical protein
MSHQFRDHRRQRDQGVRIHRYAVVLGGSITGLLAARVLRRRVHAIANVRFLDGHDAVRLTSTAERGRVTGAQTAVSSDLALPQIAGNRTMSVRLSNAAVDRLLAAAENRSGGGPAIPADDEHGRPPPPVVAPVDHPADDRETIRVDRQGVSLMITVTGHGNNAQEERQEERQCRRTY